MTDEALFLNGVYESVLKGIIRAQEKAGPDEVFYGVGALNEILS
ncbi:MAG: hypothetical protein OXJ55_07315 [Caldilineaceae bacterium]|nr:hypothetical protein [Caldilineaceae bacterium]MDE0461701.1 hypothetical protein [Caldilineaceae bacterium]MDE0462977.1 hypothetical protein [Caldilineaceae bacterium]